MTAPFSIGELESARSAMTGGDWDVYFDGNDQANIRALGQPTEWIAVLPHQCLRSIEREQQLNADGICALHAVAPALIAIAKAAIAHVDACNASASGDVYWKAVYDTKAALSEALKAVRP